MELIEKKFIINIFVRGFVGSGGSRPFQIGGPGWGHMSGLILLPPPVRTVIVRGCIAPFMWDIAVFSNSTVLILDLELLECLYIILKIILLSVKYMKCGHAVYWSMIKSEDTYCLKSLCKNMCIQEEIIKPLLITCPVCLFWAGEFHIYSNISTSLIKPVQRKPTNYDPGRLPLSSPPCVTFSRAPHAHPAPVQS